MKKTSTPKKSPAKKADSGELRKPAKLKPLKEKEKKSWKNNLEDEEEEDFNVDDTDIKLDTGFDDEDDDEFFDDTF